LFNQFSGSIDIRNQILNFENIDSGLIEIKLVVVKLFRIISEKFLYISENNLRKNLNLSI